MAVDPRTISEADWQRQVIDLARLYGWRVMHVRKSRGRRGGAAAWQTTTSIDGWPDLFMWKPDGSRPAMAMELKSEKGKTTPEQEEVLAEFRRSGIPADVYRPSQFDQVQRLLHP